MKQYKNPIITTSADGRTADSYVIRHDGKYYHCYSGHDGVYITKADELCDIASGEALKVYSSPESGKLSSWYAPELHYIDGDWYIYGAPAIDDEGKTHCMQGNPTITYKIDGEEYNKKVTGHPMLLASGLENSEHTVTIKNTSGTEIGFYAVMYR